MSIEAVICVPARNEEQRLPVLLAALARQDLAPGEALRVIILANNCTDGTAEVARAMGSTLPRLHVRVREQAWPEGIANVGLARGAAMAAGIAWLREEAGNGILVSTDADAAPPAHWLAAIRAGFAKGAEVVGGEIRIEESPGQPTPAWLSQSRVNVSSYWSAVRDLAHAIDPLPHDPPQRHGDHTGGSLAITIDAYQAVGGIPPLASREDVALVRAVELNGGRVRHPAGVWTEVSAREDGRAEGGMAGEMRRWRNLVEAGEAHLVPDAGFWHDAFRRRRAWRTMYRRRSFHGSDRLAASDLMALAARSVNDIAFVAACEELLPAGESSVVEIGRATRDLRGLIFTNLAA